MVVDGTYDNPATMRREWYVGGRVVQSVRHTVIVTQLIDPSQFRIWPALEVPWGGYPAPRHDDGGRKP